MTAGSFALGFEGEEDPVAKKAQYTAWLLAKGFQELAKGLRATLEEAYVFVKVPKLIQGPMTPGASSRQVWRRYRARPTS